MCLMTYSSLPKGYQNLTLLVGTMGYKVLGNLAKRSVAKQDRYYIKAARGADAAAMLTSEGVVVLKDSKIANTEVRVLSVSLNEFP